MGYDPSGFAAMAIYKDIYGSLSSPLSPGIGGGRSVAGLVVCAAVTYLITTSPAVTDSKPIALPFPNAAQRARERALAFSQAKAEEREKVATDPPSAPTIIYRYGGTNPGNLTPSKRDVELFPLTGKGLSFSTIPKPGAAVTTIEALNATGLVYAVKDGLGHVSVFPIGGTLEDWYNVGPSSIWTSAVKSVCTKLGKGN